MHNDTSHASSIFRVSWKDYVLPTGGTHQREGLTSCRVSRLPHFLGNDPVGTESKDAFFPPGWFLISCYTSVIWLITHTVTQTQSNFLALVMCVISLRTFPKHAAQEGNRVKCKYWGDEGHVGRQGCCGLHGCWRTHVQGQGCVSVSSPAQRETTS